jgi:hypothetical protein
VQLPAGFRHTRRADMAAFVVLNAADAATLEAAFTELADSLAPDLGKTGAYAAVADSATNALAYTPVNPGSFTRCWFSGATRDEVARIAARMRDLADQSH